MKNKLCNFGALKKILDAQSGSVGLEAEINVFKFFLGLGNLIFIFRGPKKVKNTDLILVKLQAWLDCFPSQENACKFSYYCIFKWCGRIELH